MRSLGVKWMHHYPRAMYEKVPVHVLHLLYSLPMDHAAVIRSARFPSIPTKGDMKVSEDGLSVDESNVKVIKQWPLPKTVHETSSPRLNFCLFSVFTWRILND
ncbi:hypothetical protein CsSME_00042445 [Camellia sinensis var. sinensis]